MLVNFSYQESEFYENLRSEAENTVNSYLERAELTSNMENIIEMISEVDSSNSENEFLSILLKKSLNLIPEADYARVYLHDYRGGYFLKTLNQRNIKFLNEFDNHNFKKTSEDIIFKKNINSKRLLIKLKIDQELFGAVVLYISADNESEFTDSSKSLAASLEKLSSFYLTTNRYKKLQEKFTEEIIISLTNLLEIHDNYTKGHNQNVANMSRKIALHIGLSKKEIQKAYWTGILHDIGKTIIPAKILNKKGSLSEEEYEKVKKHPEWGYKTLKHSDQLKEIASYVLYHHERWDGKGYPEGLKGTEIPVISRIVSLADAWDSMRSDRSYRKSMSKDNALNEIIKNKGKQFDSELVEIFLEKIIKIH